MTNAMTRLSQYSWVPESFVSLSSSVSCRCWGVTAVPQLGQKIAPAGSSRPQWAQNPMHRENQDSFVKRVLKSGRGSVLPAAKHRGRARKGANAKGDSE